MSTDETLRLTDGDGNEYIADLKSFTIEREQSEYPGGGVAVEQRIYNIEVGEIFSKDGTDINAVE